MLSNLLIKNYALIKHLEMQPARGFNIITGETGAGKSIMLGAIGLLMGNRADGKSVWHRHQKCVIEGTFLIDQYDLQELFTTHDWEYHHETIIRREIAISGKSRAFINDSPVNLESLRTLGSHLLDIHSQHQTLQLGAEKFQLQVLDIFGDHRDLQKHYRKAYTSWREGLKSKNALLQKSIEQKQEADYHNFLLEELNQADLSVEEQEELEDSLQVMEHAEEIKSQLNQVLQVLEGPEVTALELLDHAIRMVSRIKDLTPRYQEIHSRLNSAYIELKDLSGEISAEQDSVQYDPKVLEEQKSRLDWINRLEQKHQVSTISELLEIKSRLENQFSDMTKTEAELEELEVRIATAKDDLNQWGQKLSEARLKAFNPLSIKMKSLLGSLGINEADLTMSHQTVEPNEDGLDQVTWLFSANKGIDPLPLKQVASGGEFSRLMFCLKYILADKVKLPTILFDEIDSGVSGEIALQMVEMMRQMSTRHQVITISHLPQFAAKGDHHYFVYKSSENQGTTSEIKKLEGEERLVEVARMIGGNNPSEIALANARELLEPSN